jgi:hypothetical protein
MVDSAYPFAVDNQVNEYAAIVIDRYVVLYRLFRHNTPLRVVENTGVEPVTSTLPVSRSAQLS